MSTENASGQPEGQALPADTSQQNGTEPQSQEAKPEKTFSQAEVDEIVQRRVAKLERQQAKASDERFATLQKEIEALKSAGTAKADSQEDKPPKRDDFDTYEDFIEARAAHKARAEVKKEIDALRGERKADKEKSEKEARQKEYENLVRSRVEAGRKEFADFDATLRDALEDGVIDRSTALWDAILDSDIGHKMAHHLAKNPAEAKRIQSLSPLAQVREAGKLEDRLSAKKQQGETMDPINARAAPSTGLSDSLSTEAWIKKRNAEVSKR